MRCAGFRQALWASLDGEGAALAPDRGHRVRCGECRTYAAAALRLHGLLPEAFAPVAAPALSETVRAALCRAPREEPAGPTAAGLLCAGVLAAAALRYLGFDPAEWAAGVRATILPLASVEVFGRGRDFLLPFSALPMAWLASLSVVAAALWISTHRNVMSDSRGGL